MSPGRVRYVATDRSLCCARGVSALATLARRRFRPFSEDSYSVESYGPGSQPVIGAEADLEVAAPPVAMYPRETTDWARTATAGESRDEDTERPARASREEARPTP